MDFFYAMGIVLFFTLTVGLAFGCAKLARPK